MFDRPNILVGSDFSKTSKYAIEASKVMASKLHGKIFALHVVEMPSIANYPADLAPSCFPISSELLDSCRIALGDQLSDFKEKAEILVEGGEAFSKIKNLISQFNIDLLIIGADGKNAGLFPFGSLASKLVQSSSIPVLVLKKNFVTNRITVLADPDSDLKKLLSASEELSFILSAKLGIVSLYNVFHTRFISEGHFQIPIRSSALSEEQREEIEERIRLRLQKCLTKYVEADIKVESTFENKLCFKLSSILQGDHTDLVIMKRHEKGIVEKFFLGSETRRMLEFFEGNILVLPA